MKSLTGPEEPTSAELEAIEAEWAEIAQGMDLESLDAELERLAKKRPVEPRSRAFSGTRFSGRVVRCPQRRGGEWR